ncbi:MAG: diaminopimelate epimerase [Candidatus Omnitrophota bacterium]|nr:diaminopimelate epimerase [Candidatus Omnitrophota bacterium]
MEKINFTKMVASGNDFVITELRTKNLELRDLAKKVCNRKYGVGADGLLLLEKTKTADIKMRIFNADGSHAQMCGNGARCAALYSARNTLSGTGQKPVTSNQKKIKIETRAGIIESEVNGANVRIKLTSPKDVKLDVPIKIKGRLIKVNFINTGVPHTVIFVEGLDKIDVADIGREIRQHKEFKPGGTNVNFVQILNDDSIKVRTYERGVEDETLACGTGSVASALIAAMRYAPCAMRKINVRTQGGEVLKVYFDTVGNSFKNVCLEGKAKIVFKGEYNYV